MKCIEHRNWGSVMVGARSVPQDVVLDHVEVEIPTLGGRNQMLHCPFAYRDGRKPRWNSKAFLATAVSNIDTPIIS